MRSEHEIKGLVQEVKKGWDEVRTKAERNHDQLNVRPSYVSGLVANLDPSITTRIPLPSRRPALAAEQTEGIIRTSFSWHVEPHSGKDRASRKADALELYLAWLFSVKFDAGGKLFNPTRRDQIVGPFALWWLEWDPFVLPQDAGKRQEYREKYDPFRLYRINPLTGFFLADDNGKPTIAVREFDLPYIEVAKRYGQDKDSDPLTILREQFPGLRGAAGERVEASDLSLSKARVCVVDDGVTIAHYIDLKRNGTQYAEAFGEVPNPWGRPSMFVVPGRWNPEALNVEDRYVGALESLLVEQRNLDVMRSHLASLAFTPAKFGQSLPPEVASLLLTEEDKAMPAADFRNGIATLLGKKEEFGNQPGQAAWELLATQIAERDATLPPPYLTNPDASVLKAATAAAQLNAHETSNRIYDGMRQNLIGGVVDVCDAIKHFFCGGYGGVEGESVHFSPTGKEPTRIYAGEYKDKGLELGRDAWEMGYTLEVTPVASTASQKALEYELKKQQVMDGAAEHEELIAVHTEDVSGKKLKINIETMAQALVPAAMNLTFLKFLQTEQAADSLNLAPIAMAAGLLDPSIMGQPPVQGDAMGGTRYDPPATAVPDVAGMA